MHIRTSAIKFIIKISPLLGAAAGLVVGALLVMVWGGSPIDYFAELWKGSFGSLSKIGVTINRTTPLLISAVGTAIAFRAGAFNIGQEGQLFVGGLGAVLVGMVVADWPAIPGVIAILAGGMLFGMLLAFIPVVLKLYRGVHEVLSTLLLNFIGTLFTSFMVAGPIRDKSSSGYPQSALLPEQLHLPVWDKLGFAHAGILIAVVCALLFGYVLWFTPFGFKLRMAGISFKATQASGYNPKLMFLYGMLISGGLSGLAGAVEVAGYHNRLIYGFGTNLGFDSLSVALLGNTNPFALLPSSVFFGALRAGTMAMQRAIGVPSILLQVIQGSIILLVVIGFAVQNSKRIQKILFGVNAAAPEAKVEPGVQAQKDVPAHTNG